MILNNSIIKKVISVLTAFSITVCCIWGNIFTVSASSEDIVGYWVSQENYEALYSGEIISIKLYKLEIDSVKNNMVSGVFIRNSTHIRDYGCKHTFVNVPINNNSFTIKVNDIWSVPLTDDNSSPTAETECTYVFSIQDDSINIKNSEGDYAENTLVRYSQQNYNSVVMQQKNESYKDYSDSNIQSTDNSYTAAASSDITLIINGEAVEAAVKPYIDNGTTMVPIRGVFEALGADVAYDGETKTVIITAEEKGKTISLSVGSSSASVNGETVSLQNSAVIVNGSTMVPLRFVAEALDADVDWNGDTKTVTITD